MRHPTPTLDIKETVEFLTICSPFDEGLKRSEITVRDNKLVLDNKTINNIICDILVVEKIDIALMMFLNKIGRIQFKERLMEFSDGDTISLMFFELYKQYSQKFNIKEYNKIAREYYK